MVAPISSMKCLIVAASFLVLLIFMVPSRQTFSSVLSSVDINTTSSPSSVHILRVFVADIPGSFNYGLLDLFWSLTSPDSRIPPSSDPDFFARPLRAAQYKPYPENPLIKQYSAEYWMLGSLAPEATQSEASVVQRVHSLEDADVVFVPFFAALSAEMELGWGRKGQFGMKEGNEDYARQREVVESVKRSAAWRRSGGRDHVFVLTDPVAMWHVRKEIAPAILLVVDFGGWYKLDSKMGGDGSSNVVQHTTVSLLKDVIVPYTHLLPRLNLSENGRRSTLLYFKGAKNRHRGGLVRGKLWDVLMDEPDVVMEEGFPNATGREQSIKGMRSSEFCLHPAGDTPTSCRLFDAIASLCIPVIVSDAIELPFEGTIDYSEFAIFVSVDNALRPKWLVDHLKGITKEQKNIFRTKMASVQQFFEYDNGYPAGMGPVPPDGAVNNIWKKIQQKVPLIKEAMARERRRPEGVSVPARCHCT